MTRNRNSEPEIVVSTQGSSAASSRRKAGRSRSKRAAQVETTAAPAIEGVPVEVPALTAVEVVAREAVALESDFEPTREEIAALAYSYWESRGCQGGSAEEDWLRAEQELRSQTRFATA